MLGRLFQQILLDLTVSNKIQLKKLILHLYLNKCKLAKYGENTILSIFFFETLNEKSTLNANILSNMHPRYFI